MLELRIKQGRRHVPLFDLPAHVGRAEAYREIGDTVEGLIAFLDDLGGDPDLEDDDPDGEHDGREPDDDAQGDTSWTEWHTRGRFKDNPGVIARDGRQLLEDMEDDDQDQCLAADDDPARLISDGLPGDSFDTELNGDEGDYSPGAPWE